MARDSYTLEVIGEIEKYAQAVGKIPGITDKQVAKATVAFQQRWYRAQDQAGKAAAKAASEAAGGWDRLADNAGAAGDVAKKLRGVLGNLSGAAGEAAGWVDDIGDAIGVLASPAGAAVAAVGALAAGTVALGVGLVKTVFAADEALDSLEGFRRIDSDWYPAVPTATLASIEAANASTAALGSIWDKAIVTLGSSATPTVEAVANVLVGAALSAGELFDTVAQGVDVLNVFGRAAIAYLIAPVAGVVDVLAEGANAMVALTRVAGVQLPEAMKANVGLLNTIKERLDLAAAGFVDGAVAGTALGDVWGGLSAKGAKFIATQIRATKAMEGGKQQAYDLARALVELGDKERVADESRLEGMGRLRAARDQELRQVDDVFAREAAAAVAAGEGWDTLATLQAAADASRLAITEKTEREIQVLRAETQAQILAGLEEGQQAQAQKAQAVIDARTTLISSMEAANDAAFNGTIDQVGAFADAYGGLFADMAQQVGEANQEAGLKAFRAAQVIGIAQATVAAYKAGAETAAAVAAIPGGQAFAIPAGIAMGAAVGTTFVAKIRDQEPPSFAMGGIGTLSGGGGMHAPDDDVRLSRRELFGILTTRGIREAGGPQGVRALNRGAGGSAPAPAVTELGGRLEDRGVALRRVQANAFSRLLQEVGGVVGGKTRRDRRAA